MEHAVEELVPRQRSTPAAPAALAAQPDPSRERRRSRRPWPLESVGRPARHRQETARLRTDMREFESALARWAR
jgi:hypothetical protein